MCHSLGQTNDSLTPVKWFLCNTEVGVFVTVPLSWDASLDEHTHVPALRLPLQLPVAGWACRSRVQGCVLLLQCTLFLLSSGASLESVCSGSLSQDRENQCGVEPSNQTIYHMENKINFSAVLLCFRCSQKMRYFFIWGTFVHVSPVYFTGSMRCDSSIVLYVCRIRTSIKLTNSGIVTIIHTAAGKTATCSVLDIFSRKRTALSRYPEGCKSLLPGTHEHAHSFDSFSPLCLVNMGEKLYTRISSSCGVIRFLQS